jgi:hypothetical protein
VLLPEFADEDHLLFLAERWNFFSQSLWSCLSVSREEMSVDFLISALLMLKIN